MAGPTAAQAKLRELGAQARALADKGIMSADESKQFETTIAEMRGLKAQIEAVGGLEEIEGWAAKSGGMVPLVPGTEHLKMSGVEVHGMKDAGGTVISDEDRRGLGLKILHQYGEGIYDEQVLGATKTDAYRQAFKSYMRHGHAGVKADGLKVLQEGVDTQGGFLVPADVLDRVISRLPTPTRVAGRTTQLTTSRDQLIIPKVVYTADDLKVGVAA